MRSNLLHVLVTVGLVVALPAIAAKQNVNGEYLRDPTQPLFFSAPSSQKQALKLQGIVKRDSGKEAIVNGKRVQVGSAVAGARIVAIEEKYILVLQNGSETKIWLRPSVRD